MQSELAVLERFIQTLQDEQSALIDANLDRLVKLTQVKSELSEQLNLLARDRAAALEKRGVQNTRADVERWLDSQPREIALAWNTLIERAEVAQQLNQTNGKLIENQLQQTQQALNVLSSAANQSTIYGADGQTRGLQPSTQRILGKG